MGLEELNNEILELKKLIVDFSSCPPKEYLSLEESAIYLGISKSSMYKLSSARKVAQYKPNGKLLLFKVEDLKAFVEKGRIEPEEHFLAIADKMLENFEL